MSFERRITIQMMSRTVCIPFGLMCIKIYPFFIFASTNWITLVYYYTISCIAIPTSFMWDDNRVKLSLLLNHDNPPSIADRTWFTLNNVTENRHSKAFLAVHYRSPNTPSNIITLKLLSWPVRDVANYARCITAFSRLYLVWAMYNLRMYMIFVWLFC